MDKRDELIKKLEEYQKLLCDELDEVVVMMSIHGWKSTRYEQGKKLRDEIVSLKAEVEKEPEAVTAYDFLLMKLKPASGSLRTGIINSNYAAILMEEYVKSKSIDLRGKITDSDIEAWASLQSNPESKKDFERGLWLGLKVGAKAVINGEIKKIEK